MFRFLTQVSEGSVLSICSVSKRETHRTWREKAVELDMICADYVLGDCHVAVRFEEVLSDLRKRCQI